MCYRTGTGQQWVCLRLACSVWVLDFMQERCHNMSPGDLESTFVKAGDSETKEGLRIEEVTRESLGRAALAPQKSYRKGVSQGGDAVSSPGSQRKGTLETESGVKPGSSCHCPLVPRLQISLGVNKSSYPVRGMGLLQGEPSPCLCSEGVFYLLSAAENLRGGFQQTIHQFSSWILIC